MENSSVKTIAWLQILTLIIIPSVNLYSNFSTQKQSIDKDYVQLAISLLQNQNTNEELRKWATKVLNEKAPIRFQEEVVTGLGNGSLFFPILNTDLLKANKVEIDLPKLTP
jgi:hypothetical protein